jgi:hypothetical protein
MRDVLSSAQMEKRQEAQEEYSRVQILHGEKGNAMTAWGEFGKARIRQVSQFSQTEAQQMKFGKRDPEQEVAEYDPDENETDETVVDHLYDILTTMERTEKLITELVNQGDKQVEFLSRITTVFERMEKAIREAE